MSIVEREATSVTSPVKSEPVVEPLYPEFLRAAEIIREQGWSRCGGGYPAVCIMQSVGRVVPRLASSPPRINEYARCLGFRDACDAFVWNDAPGRTLEEVLDRLERAAYGL